MKKEKKSAQIIIRLTEKEKDFLIHQAEEENRTISTIVKVALGEKYKEYEEMRNEKRNA